MTDDDDILTEAKERFRRCEAWESRARENALADARFANAAASANTLFVCPLGGTCTTAAGIPLAVGESKTWMLSASTNGALVSPTVISGGTATALVSW